MSYTVFFNLSCLLLPLQLITIGNERFRCPEVLFAPSMVGLMLTGVYHSFAIHKHWLTPDNYGNFGGFSTCDVVDG